MRSLLAVTIALAVSGGPANAMQAGVPMGRVQVSPRAMEANCITMVSPMGTGNLLEAANVVVHVVVSKAGNVFPVYAVSGPPALQAEALDTVRLWRYKPFIRNGEALDVNTDLRVDFIPKTPGGMVTHPKHLSSTQ